MSSGIKKGWNCQFKINLKAIRKGTLIVTNTQPLKIQKYKDDNDNYKPRFRVMLNLTKM